MAFFYPARLNVGLVIAVIFSVAVIAKWEDAGDLEHDEDAPGVVNLVELTPFDADQFSPQDRADVDEWPWPDVDDFRQNWEEVLATGPAPTMVIADIRIESIDVEGCDHVDDQELFDVILGLSDVAEGTLIFVPDEVSYLAYRALVHADIYNIYEPVLVLHEASTQAHYRDGCRDLYISPSAIYPGTVPGREYLGHRVYAATLLTFDEPVFDERYPIVSEYWNPYLEQARNVNLNSRRQKLRLYMHPSRCGYRGVSDYNRLYQEICLELHDTGCVAQLAHLTNFDWMTLGSSLPATLNTGLGQLKPSPIDPARFVLGTFFWNPANGYRDRWAKHGFSRQWFIAPWSTPTIHGNTMAPLVRQFPNVFVGHLQRWAQDPDLDSYNRLRATAALYRGGYRYFGDPRQDYLKDLDLDELSQFWLENYAEPY